MSRTRHRMWQSFISVVLAVCLTFSMTVPAFAYPPKDGNGDGVINYVSLGDSMTNGYGLPGYDGNTGVEDYGDGSYANLFADYLGAGDSHAQLAMSAMRAEDLHWLLEFDYTDVEAINLTDGAWDEDAWNAKFTTGDYWTWNELCDDYRFAVAAYAIQNSGAIGKITDDEAAIVAEYYQNAVKDADIISLGMGNGNFGVFMFGRLLEAIGFSGTPADAMVYDFERALAECDPVMQEKILELKDVLYAEIEAYLGTSIEGNPALEALVNTVVYTCVSYVLNYAGSVDAILQLNPDAEIILVALMNTYKDTVEVEGVTIGDLLDVVFTPLNAFIAALPTYMQATGNSVYADATFYYAEPSYVDCLVNEFGEDFDDPDSTIRDRFVQSIVVDEDGDLGMVWDMLDGVELVDGVALTPVSLAEIAAYEAMEDAEKAAYAAANTQKAVSVAVYLAFEDAVLASKDAPVTVESVLGLGNLSPDLFGDVMEDFSNNVNANAAVYATDKDVNAVVAAVVKATVEVDYGSMLEGFDLTADDFMAMGAAGTLPAVGDTNLQELYDNAMSSTLGMLCMLLALPETLSDSVQKDESLSGLLALFGRCVIGNGLGGHPSADGHKTLFEAVKASYETGYTAKDETVNNLVAAGEAAAALVAEYYDEAYAYGYQYAKDNGYVDQAIAGIDAVIAELAAINLDDAEMTDALKAEVAGEIEEIIETLEAAKALILEADVLDQDSLDALIAMLDEAGESIENLLSVLEQAGIDVNDLVVTPALEAAYDKLTNEVIPQVCADLQKAVEAGAEWLAAQLGQAYNDFIVAAKEAAVKYAPEAADAIYNYLLNNPEDVLAFLNEYGDDAIAFLGQYEQEIFAVLGFLAVNYGDDLVEFVLAHPEEILDTLVEWVDTHGENAWELVKAYADASGLTAAVQAEIDALEAELDALKAQLESDLGNLSESAKAEIEKQIALVEAQIAELEGLLAELGETLLAGEAEIEAFIAEINAAYNDLMAAVEQLQAAAEQAGAEIKAAVDAVVAAAEVIQAAIDAFVDELPEAAQAAYDKLLAQLEELVSETASDAAQWLYDWLLENPDKVLAFLAEYGDDALSFVADHSDAILAIVEYLLDNYGDDVLDYMLENADQIFVTLVDLVEEYGDEAWELVKAYADASGLTAAVQAEIDVLEAQLEALKAELENAGAEAKAAIKAQIALIEAQIAELEALLAELNAAIAEGKAEVEALLAEIQAAYDELMAAVEKLEVMAEALDAEIQAAVAEIVAAAEALQAKVEALVGDVVEFAENVQELYAQIVGFVEDVYAGVIEQAQKAFADLDAEISEVFDAIDAQIAAALEQLGAEAAETLKAAFAKAEADLHALIAEAIQMIIDGTFDAEALQSLIDGMYAALDELEAALEDLDAETAAAVKAQIAQLKIQIALIENLVANYLAAAVEDATHGEYVITEMSRYAAIGDATILADNSYADQLAAKLADIAAAEGASFDPATQYDELVLVDENDGVATTADILAKIQSGDWNEAIANADLITVSMGAEDLTVAVNEQLLDIVAAYADSALAGEAYVSTDATDWTSVVGDEGAAYIDDIVAEIYAELLESLGDESAAAMATDIVEAYAFAYVGFATSYAEVLNAVQALSPDAQVVAVGLNNVFDGLVFNFGGDEINVGEYAAYVVKAADLQLLAYAMLDEGDNVTFVSAPEAESDAATIINELISMVMAFDFEGINSLDPKDPDFLNKVQEYTNKLNAIIDQINLVTATASWMPNAAGQEYILGQIMDAMTITVEKAEEPVVKHTVTFETNDGRCCFIVNDDYENPYYEGSIEVADGESLTFLVAVELEYELESLLVDGVDVTADIVDHVYTIESVTKDMVISGKAVLEDDSVEFVRLAGTGYNRYSTMDAIATEGFDTTGGTVIVAYSLNYPDALAASGLAGIHEAPIVLTDTDAMTDLAIGQLERLKPSKVIVVGSEGVVSENVVNEIAVAAPNAEIERYYGSDRYATALDIYNETEGWGNTAIVAGGLTFADALSISPYAYATKSPIFLTSGSGTYEDNPVLNEASIEAIKAGGFERIVVVGGETCVDTAALAASLGIEVTDLKVLAGKNRYETSALIAEFAVSEGLSYDGMAIATGDNFPDALTGGPLCGKNGSVLLLAGDSLGNGSLNVIYDVVGAHAESINFGYFLGSEYVVTEVMVDAVYECLGITA